MDLERFKSDYAALEAGGLLQINFPRSDDVENDERWRRTFNDFTPRQVYERFAKAGGVGNKVKVKVTLPAYDRLATIEIRHNSEFTASEYQNALILKVQDEVASIERSFLRGDDQGKNLAKRYLKVGADLLQKIGVETLTVKTEQVGGYAWTRYGFVPADDHAWENLTSAARSGLRGNFLVLEGQRYDVTSELPRINQFLKTDFSELADSFGEQISKLDRRIGEWNGKPLTVAKALLMNITWDGILRLDDKDKNFQRFKRYTATEEHQLARA
jgi:hypothetical protein